MKTAIVYYSLNGNCAFVAEEIKANLDCDLIPLHTKDDKKRKGLSKFFWSFGLMISKKPPLKPYTFDPSAYDLIIIGSPVWAAAPASPLKTFLSDTEIKGKKIALFACHAGGLGQAMDKFKTLLPGNDIISEMDINEPSSKDSEGAKQMIAEWVKRLF
ncbi:MAG: flavodoxin [Treponema sp.]|nr:flavodoxin [Treponema sp.]